MRIPFFKSKPPYSVEEIQAWEDVQIQRRKAGDQEGAEMAGKVISFYLEELEHWITKQKRKPSIPKQVEAILEEARRG